MSDKPKIEYAYETMAGYKVVLIPDLPVIIMSHEAKLAIDSAAFRMSTNIKSIVSSKNGLIWKK